MASEAALVGKVGKVEVYLTKATIPDPSEKVP